MIFLPFGLIFDPLQRFSVKIAFWDLSWFGADKNFVSRNDENCDLNGKKKWGRSSSSSSESSSLSRVSSPYYDDEDNNDDNDGDDDSENDDNDDDDDDVNDDDELNCTWYLETPVLLFRLTGRVTLVLTCESVVIPLIVMMFILMMFIMMLVIKPTPQPLQVKVKQDSCFGE